MSISASMVKALRERTGAGMMECKKALVEANGDADAAAEILRKSGQAKADKKSSRVAADGRVVIAANGAGAVIAEINSETDFVARNDVFQKMVREIAETALSTDGAVESVRAAAYPGAGKSVEEHVAEMVGQIGENMTLRRSAAIAVAAQRAGKLMAIMRERGSCKRFQNREVGGRLRRDRSCRTF